MARAPRFGATLWGAVVSDGGRDGSITVIAVIAVIAVITVITGAGR